MRRTFLEDCLNEHTKNKNQWLGWQKLDKFRVGIRAPFTVKAVVTTGNVYLGMQWTPPHLKPLYQGGYSFLKELPLLSYRRWAQGRAACSLACALQVLSMSQVTLDL